MGNKRVLRILSVAACIFLLCSGGAILAIMSQFDDVSASPLGTGIFTIFTMLLMFVLTVVEFVSMLRISSSTYHTMLVAFFLSVSIAFSPEMFMFNEFIGVPVCFELGEIVSELGFAGVAVSVLAFFRNAYFRAGKRPLIFPLIIFAALCVTAYGVFIAFFERIFVHAILLVSVVGWHVYFGLRVCIADTDDITFALSSVIMFCSAGMQTANVLSYTGLVRYEGGFSVAYIWMCIICFAVIYTAFFIRTDRAARRAADYQLQNERLKMKVLMGQIKSHFVFNALTTIKSCYHSNIAAGDSALELFSEYMRESLSLIETEVIGFEQELNSVSHYIDFINTSRIRPFNIIYNIDYSDFRLPAFTLQPFIENAVKYSKVNEREDGYIMISACRDGDFAEIRVTDNGVGFNPEVIKDGAHGIANSRERLRLLMGAAVDIVSVPGKGTEITIRIKCEEEGEK